MSTEFTWRFDKQQRALSDKRLEIYGTIVKFDGYEARSGGNDTIRFSFIKNESKTVWIFQACRTNAIDNNFKRPFSAITFRTCCCGKSKFIFRSAYCVLKNPKRALYDAKIKNRRFLTCYGLKTQMQYETRSKRFRCTVANRRKQM